MAQGAVLVARMSAKFTWEGQEVFLAEGRTTIREGHPILDDHAELFQPLVPTFETEEPQPRGRRAKADGDGEPGA
jgi:hypothetical protein